MKEQFQRLPADTPRFMERLQDNLERLFLGLLREKPRGEIWTEGNTTATAMAVQNQWYRIKILTTAGDNKDVGTDLVSGTLLIKEGGVYRVIYSSSFSGSVNDDFEVEAARNGGSELFGNLHLERALNASGDIGSAGFSGRVRLKKGDVFEVWGRCTTGAAASMTVKDANLMIEKVGD